MSEEKKQETATKSMEFLQKLEWQRTFYLLFSTEF